MFKAFLTRNETTQDGLPSYNVSLAINGEELLDMMPMELQNVIEDMSKEDEEIRDMFKRSFVLTMSAQKTIDITNMQKGDYKKELDEVSETSFFDEKVK